MGKLKQLLYDIFSVPKEEDSNFKYLRLKIEDKEKYEQVKIKAGIEDDKNFLNFCLTLADQCFEQIIDGKKIAFYDPKNCTFIILESEELNKIHPVI